MLGTGKSRIDRMEREIADLRATQNKILKLLTSVGESPPENADILGEKLRQLRQDESQGDWYLPPLPDFEARLRERNAFHQENRAILLAIAKHLGVTIEKPKGDDQPD